jgi:membrane protease YdiL (CAAX protease family)
MSTRAAHRHVAPLPTGLTVAAGLAILLGRVWLAGVADPARSVALAVLLGGILAAALLVRVREDRPRARTLVAVVAAGLTVALAAGLVAGPRPPVPWAAAALPLAVLAAVAEEALFRRVLYARLLRFGAVVAVVATALGFALLHVPAYGWVAFPVDLGAGLILGWQRHAAGTWLAPAWTHALINAAVTLR